MENDRLSELESKLTQMQRHVVDQDREIYRLSQKLEQQNQALSKLRIQLESALSGRMDGGDMPANERPPHY